MWLAALVPPSLRINLFEKRYTVNEVCLHFRPPPNLPPLGGGA